MWRTVYLGDIEPLREGDSIFISRCECVLCQVLFPVASLEAAAAAAASATALLGNDSRESMEPVAWIVLDCR